MVSQLCPPSVGEAARTQASGFKELAEIYLGRDPGEGFPKPSMSPPQSHPPPRLPALCKDQGTEMRRGQFLPRLWGGLTDIMFATLKEKVFNGMKMSLITGAKLCSVWVQGDRDALVLQLHFHLT